MIVFSKIQSMAGALFQDKGQQLLLAASQHDVGKVKALIQNNADVNTQDSTGRSPLMIVAARKLHPGDNIAVLKEYFEIANLLIQNKANVDAQDNQGRTALMYIGCERALHSTNI